MLFLGLVEVPLWSVLLAGAGIGLYVYGTKNHDFFKKQGIPGPKPLPFIGNAHTLMKMGFYDTHLHFRKIYGKTYGLFTGGTPELITFDEEIISEITVKQFSNFTDRRSQLIGDPNFDNMITVLHGDHWKNVRSQMSPAFTTGKLRQMTEVINRGAKMFFKSLVSSDGPFEARKIAGAYTMDIIASTAFGLRLETQGDENNTFIKHGKELVDISFGGILIYIFFIAPSLMPILSKFGINLISPSASNFFASIVEQAMEGRLQESDKSRADFIQLMVNAQQGRDAEEKSGKTAKSDVLSKQEILSNALIFFLAGYDTTSVGLSKLMYLLACNPECQQKAIDEVDSLIPKDKENIDYDDVMKMQYLEQCLQETLRLYPAAVVFDRQATADTVVCGMKIAKGTVVTIPSIGIHYDPDIWSEPTKFDPDRFTPEKKANMNPFHWLPFGYGPRNCIGMRLALLEIKLAVATVLRTHKFMTCEKTQIPLQMSKDRIMHSKDGIWLVLEKRD